MSISKLSLLNDCLLICGEATFTAADDGSGEWNVVSASYDSGLRLLLADHNWKFTLTIEAVEDRSDPDDPNWEDAYARPSNITHITRVMDADGTAITDFKILGNNILVNEDGGLLVEGVEDKDPSLWPNYFAQVMERFVFSGIYRGIKHDTAAADAQEDRGMKLLARARPRTDMEEPATARNVSRLALARGTRRG